MKITAIETFPVYNGARNNLFVTVDTDEGISGVGESGLSGRELAVIGAIDHFRPLLIGEDATRIEYIWQVLFRGGFFPANRVLCSAISAIDIALWDIQGKALGVPIYRLLGGLARDLDSHFAVNFRQRPQMRRQHHPDHCLSHGA